MMTAENLIKNQAPPESAHLHRRRPSYSRFQKTFYKGQAMTLRELSDLPECSVGWRTVRDRIRVWGWTVTAAVTTPNLRATPELTPERKACIIEDYKRLPQLKMLQKYKIGYPTLKAIVEEAR